MFNFLSYLLPNLVKFSHGQWPFCLHHKIDQEKKKKKLPKKSVLKFFQGTKEKENKFGSNYKILVFEQFEQMKQFPFTP